MKLNNVKGSPNPYMDRVVKGEYLAGAIQSKTCVEITAESGRDWHTIKRYMESLGISRLEYRCAKEGQLEFYKKEAALLENALSRCYLGVGLLEDKIRIEKEIVKKSLDRIAAEG